MSIEKQIFELMDNPATKEKGFTLLMNTFQKDIYWHIRGIVNTHEDTDDVIQNTFVKVYRYFDRFKREANLFTWIYRIATNESLTHLKKIKRNQTDSLDNVYHLNYEDNGHYQSEEIIEKLNKVVNTLPEKQRIVFNMRYYEEMPYKKMAEILETSEGALKASYHIAIKKIEAELIA